LLTASLPHASNLKVITYATKAKEVNATKANVTKTYTTTTTIQPRTQLDAASVLAATRPHTIHLVVIHLTTDCSSNIHMYNNYPTRFKILFIQHSFF
jgi:hypothetical protein